MSRNNLLDWKFDFLQVHRSLPTTSISNVTHSRKKKIVTYRDLRRLKDIFRNMSLGHLPANRILHILDQGRRELMSGPHEQE